jgi:AbrB family looped-hinge helix DNA binding protein
MAEYFVQMGKRGTLVIPAKVRKALGITDGSLLLLKETDGAVEIRAAKLETPIPDARLELAKSLLSSAAGLGEYLAAIEEVRRMGFEPEDIPHERR